MEVRVAIDRLCRSFYIYGMGSSREVPHFANGECLSASHIYERDISSEGNVPC